MTDSINMPNIPPSKESDRLTLTGYAPLKVVEASNYLRYGPTGVRRYGPDAPAEPPAHPHTITATFAFKDALGEVKATYEDVTLRDEDPTVPFTMEGTTIWRGGVGIARTTLTWVWDFYRMYSGLRISVRVPKPDADVRLAWRDARNLIESLQPGDKIVVSVSTESSDILQVYPVDAPASVLAEGEAP